MKPSADKISESELEVMRIVWDYARPVTYAEIRDGLDNSGWASDTIHTLVRRLHQKGVLKRTKDGVYYYTPVISEGEYLEEKTKSFVAKVYGGNVKGLLSKLMDYESVEQNTLEELKGYWRDSRKGKEGEKDE